jgi:hypothetical protein
MKSVVAAAAIALCLATPAMAWMPKSLYGLEGSWYLHGQTILNKAGYQSVWSVNAKTYWWNIGNRTCVLTLQDGVRYVGVERMPEEVCTMAFDR